jgi:nucleotide-binding universal stress UspA family protein
MFPPRVILAAVDFSEPSRVALSFAARLAKHCKAHLHVLHAEEPLLANAAQASGIDLTAETRAELTAFMQKAPPAGDWTPSHHVVTGSAVDAICHIGERESADLIVVGARGMTGLETMLFGSTTEGVLRKADTSVLVVPEGWTPPRPELNDLTGTGPVVVGLEATPASIAAARVAGELASLLGTSIDVRHVVPPIPVLARWSSHAEKAQHARVEAAKAEIASAVHLAGIAPAAVQVEVGAVAEQLAKAVAVGKDRNPVLVLGRRTSAERGGAPGSTAYRVLSLSAAPVLMILPEH